MLADEIKAYMAERGSAFLPRVYESVDSTNTVLAALAREGAPEFTAVIAGAQTAGRGRGEHRFFSPAGCGVYFSLLLRPRFPAETAAKLITPASAVAAAQAIERVSGETAGIKWVNDIFVRGRKVCGILTEAAPDGSGGLAWVIPGIGINVRAPEGGYPAEISATAGAVYPGEAPEDAAARLAVETLDRLIELYRAMPECGFRAEYDRRLTLKGRRVSYGSGRHGTVLVVDSDFRLLIRTEQGSTEALDSGEVRCTDTI